MQLKSLAKSTEVLNKVTSVLNNTELSHLATKQALEEIGRSYTTETLKAAIAQSTLDKEQIKTILSANGLQGELLVRYILIDYTFSCDVISCTHTMIRRCI